MYHIEKFGAAKPRGGAEVVAPNWFMGMATRDTGAGRLTFDAMAGVPYHVWVRLRAQANSLNNDSLSALEHALLDAGVDVRIAETTRARTLAGMTPG